MRPCSLTPLISLTLRLIAGEKDTQNVIRGLKAAINNPRVSEEAKQRDRERLDEMEQEYSASDYSGAAETPEMDYTYEIEDEEVATSSQSMFLFTPFPLLNSIDGFIRGRNQSRSRRVQGDLDQYVVFLSWH